MSKQASGKAYEKRVAKVVEGRHIRRESYGLPAPDIEHPLIVGECKLRKSLALETWMTQVEKHSEPGKTCAVFCKAKNLNDDKTIVCVRLPDFLRLIDALRNPRL